VKQSPVNSQPKLVYRRPLILAVIAATTALVPRMAFAHAVLVNSVPALNSAVQCPDLPLSFKFNSRLDASKSGILIVDPSGQSRKLTIDKQTAPDTLTARASQLRAGKYTIRWQVLSVDGHVTHGEVPFEVK
jgi:copper resistance protein C